MKCNEDIAADKPDSHCEPQQDQRRNGRIRDHIPNGRRGGQIAVHSWLTSAMASCASRSDTQSGGAPPPSFASIASPVPSIASLRLQEKMVARDSGESRNP
jgi:hypothetical protein